MVVVMAIIAVLSTLSASAFINARNQATVSDDAERLLSALREAQNRSISITKGKDTGTGETKAWGVALGENPAKLVYFDNISIPPSSSLNMQTQEYISLKSNLRVTTPSPSYIVYTAPFAKSYAMADSCTPPDTCSWVKTSNPTQDWAPDTSLDLDESITIILTYNRSTQKIIVNEKGDAYLE